MSASEDAAILILELEEVMEKAAHKFEKRLLTNIRAASSDIYQLRPRARMCDPESIDGGGQVHVRINQRQQELVELNSQFVLLQNMQSGAVEPRITKNDTKRN